jgi:hypothetical protein
VNAEPVDTPRHRPNTSHQQGVTDFTAAVNRYAELHRLLEIPLAAPALAADPERKARARKQLRAAIREARAAVLPGDVFTPEVSEYFRHRIELAARDADGAIPVILEALPELPDEVEYRFFGRDLVLLDVEAGLVVDVLKQALPLDEGKWNSRNSNCAHQRIHPLSSRIHVSRTRASTCAGASWGVFHATAGKFPTSPA